MAIELAPGVFTRVFAQAAALAQSRTGAALTTVAAQVASQAQVNASVGQHPYGTPTPARPGTGPAMISKTLVYSIAYTYPVKMTGGWAARVGARSGMYPTYNGRRSKTPSSRYGYYLETGLRNGVKYPWLYPATRIAPIVATTAFGVAFSGPWL